MRIPDVLTLTGGTVEVVPAIPSLTCTSKKNQDGDLWGYQLTVLLRMVLLFVLHLPWRTTLPSWFTRTSSDHLLRTTWNDPPCTKTYSLRFSQIKQPWISKRQTWFFGVRVRTEQGAVSTLRNAAASPPATTCFLLLSSVKRADATHLKPSDKRATYFPIRQKGKFCAAVFRGGCFHKMVTLLRSRSRRKPLDCKCPPLMSTMFTPGLKGLYLHQAQTRLPAFYTQ